MTNQTYLSILTPKYTVYKKIIRASTSFKCITHAYNIIFKQNKKSNNSKVQGDVFILKTIEEQLRYLDAFCSKGII